MKLKAGDDWYEVDEQELPSVYKKVFFPVDEDRIRHAIRANYLPKGVRKIEQPSQEATTTPRPEDILPAQ